MRRLRSVPCPKHSRGPAAWTFSVSRGLQLHVSRVAPLGTQKTQRTQSTHDCRLPSSPVASGKRPCLSREFLRSGNPAACTETLLMACGRRCVLSPRPSHSCPSRARQAGGETARQAEGETARQAEGSTGGPTGGSESRQTAPPTARGGGEERPRSSVAGRREQPTVARRPSTAPARAQTRHRDLARPPAEAPSCRVVWRQRRGENTNSDSLDCTAGATPVLHLYLPGPQLTDGAYNTTDEEKSSSENDKRLDNRTNKQLDIVSITSTNQQEVTTGITSTNQQEVTTGITSTNQQEVTTGITSTNQQEVTTGITSTNQQEVATGITSTNQQEVATGITSTNQQEVATGKQQQETTTAQRHHDTRLRDQNDTTDRNGERGTGTGKECDITGGPAHLEGVDKHGEGAGRQDLTEDKLQHDIAQDTLSDITTREENNLRFTGDDIRHDYTQNSDDYTQNSDDYTQDTDNYTQDSGQPDLRRERGDACDAADANNGSEGTEPDFSNTPCHAAPERTQQIKTPTHGSEKNNLSQTSMDHQDRGNQQVQESRGNVTPRQLGCGDVQGRAAHTSSLSSESQRLERSFQPVPTILIPSTITLTPPHTPHTPHMPHTPAALPSYCRTFFGYRIRMFHTSELLYTKTQATRVAFEEPVIKPTKKLSRGPQGTGSQFFSRGGVRGITRHHPKITGSLPCKVKTTKTFVWGSWGPLETKSVCELHTQNYRCQSSDSDVIKM